MLSDPYTKMMFELLELRRMVSQGGDRVGSVHEVNKDKVRVVMGIRPDGSPWLSPWLHTEDHRGFSSDNTGHTQRQVYSVGQSVKISVGNDHRSGTVSPYSPSTSQQPPAHADNYLDDKQAPTAETYQNGKLRMASGHVGNDKNKKKFHDIWIDENDDKPQAHQEQSGQAQSGGAQQQPQQQALTKSKPLLKMRISEDGFFTARYKTDTRVAAHSAGAKVKSGTNFASVTKSQAILKAGSGNAYVHAAGTLYVNKPPVIGDAPSDPIPDDNA